MFMSYVDEDSSRANSTLEALAIGAMMTRSSLVMMRGWPQVDARVLASRIVVSSSSSSGSRSSGPMYDTEVKFHYVVNGVTYDSWPQPGIARFSDPALVAATSARDLVEIRRPSARGEGLVHGEPNGLGVHRG